MTTKEAAALAGVSETIIKRWCAEGRVTATKTGRSWDIDPESLAECAAQPRAGRGPDKGTRRANRSKETA